MASPKLSGSHYNESDIINRNRYNSKVSVVENTFVNTWNSTRKTNAPTKTKKHTVANLPKRQTQCRVCGRPVGNQYAWQCKYPTYY